MEISAFAIMTDHLFDRIPLVSSVTNILVIAIKILLGLPILKSCTDSKLLNYLKKKSFNRCLILLIPIFGNAFIAYQDYRNLAKLRAQSQIIS